ncbi:hypothetical protein LCGC14_2654410, partial [marine sediment metagenome]
MGTELTCPECGSKFQATDKVLGQTVTCLSCGESFVASQGAEPEYVLADLAALTDGEATGDPSANLAEAAAAASARRPARRPPPASNLGDFVLDCLKSFYWGLRNIPNVVVMLIAYTMVAAVLVLGLALAGAFLVQTGAGRLLLLFFAVCVYGALGGYFLRYFLNVVSEGIEGDPDGTPPPQWNFAEQVILAFKWFALCLVYS